MPTPTAGEPRRFDVKKEPTVVFEKYLAQSATIVLMVNAAREYSATL